LTETREHAIIYLVFRELKEWLENVKYKKGEVIVLYFFINKIAHRRRK